MTEQKHLWELEHPYYCHNANFYHRDELEEFDSWEIFIEKWGGADMDLNLLFRWDWHLKGHWSDDSDILQLFFILQRKGIFRPCEIKVTKNDEVKVIEYLKPRFRHLSALWVPVVTGIKIKED